MNLTPGGLCTRDTFLILSTLAPGFYNAYLEQRTVLWHISIDCQGRLVYLFLKYFIREKDNRF